MSKNRDNPNQLAFDMGASPQERRQAMGELQKSYAPRGLSDLIPREDVMAVIRHIEQDFADQAMHKAISKNVVPFPGKFQGQRGMQSVRIDDWKAVQVGDYWEKPSIFSFDSLRLMVDQTPILNAVMLTRVRQIQRFCGIQENGIGPGFAIRHRDRNHELNETERDSVKMLEMFFSNCGWEFNPRRRKALRRDSFPQFMAKLVRDSLTLDSCAIETEMKRDRKLGIDGLYAVDGATIRLCSEDGYEGHDELFALQVVEGRIRTAYSYDDLIYEPRNPRSDVAYCGYGMSECELLVRVVTGWLNALTYNIKGFDSNSIPKGMLHLTGNYDNQDIAAFKRYWNAMVKGINNSWTLPVMVSKDQESKAAFEKFGIDFNEMYFAKWMTFLTSIICAIYGMSPAEINFDSFTGGNTSALAGSDTEEKLADSKDKGLRPLLSYYENLFTDFIVRDFSDKYVFRWTGLDEEDEKQRFEADKLILTVNEMRSQRGQSPMEGPMGDAPLNPSLVGPWMQLQQGQGGGAPGQPGPGGPAGGDGGPDGGGEDFGTVDEDQGQGGDQQDQGADANQDQGQGDQDGAPDFGKDQGADFGKSLTIYTIEP